MLFLKNNLLKNNKKIRFKYKNKYKGKNHLFNKKIKTSKKHKRKTNKFNIKKCKNKIFDKSNPKIRMKTKK